MRFWSLVSPWFGLGLRYGLVKISSPDKFFFHFFQIILNGQYRAFVASHSSFWPFYRKRQGLGSKKLKFFSRLFSGLWGQKCGSAGSKTMPKFQRSNDS